jgi:hypothetical protein
VDQRHIIGHADGFVPVFGGDGRHGYFASTEVSQRQIIVNTFFTSIFLSLRPSILAPWFNGWSRSSMPAQLNVYDLNR